MSHLALPLVPHSSRLHIHHMTVHDANCPLRTQHPLCVITINKRSQRRRLGGWGHVYTPPIITSNRPQRNNNQLINGQVTTTYSPAIWRSDRSASLLTHVFTGDCSFGVENKDPKLKRNQHLRKINVRDHKDHGRLGHLKVMKPSQVSLRTPLSGLSRNPGKWLLEGHADFITRGDFTTRGIHTL
ncbi:hypothetical protein J6590_066442 [Homalodisca vitripennis]|nr:hypothetical protein J6590_066442 [Homalodisca vitripennis]